MLAITRGIGNRKGNIMHKISKYRLLMLCGFLAFGLALSACDGDNSKVNSGDDKEDVADTQKDEDTTSTDPNKDAGPDITEEPDAQVTPGFMNGAWKLTDTSDDAVIAFFDLTHLEGNTDVKGGFLTGAGLYDGLLEGGVGVLAESSYEGSTLKIQWNPTTQDVEMLTLNATQVDDDTFSGTVTAVQNVELDLPVKLVRDSEAPGN